MKKRTLKDIFKPKKKETKVVSQNQEIEIDRFPWGDVEACMNNVIPAAYRLTSCPKCGKELRWIRFCSPAWTWQQLCGREGPLAICENCHKQVYFFCEMMN